MGGDSKNWAKEYILDPLNAPEPSQETGPGTHFGNTLSSSRKETSSYPTPPASAGLGSPTTIGSNNPFRNSLDSPKNGSVNRAASTGGSASRLQKSPPPTRSPRNSGQYRKEAFSTVSEGRPRASSHGHDHGHTHSRNASTASNGNGTRSRGDSLNQRPLEFAAEEAKNAHRSPHLKKKHLPGQDSIDKLDVFGYHHAGPYDAALLARNTSWESSPLAAVADTNREALKATPRENVIDSIRRHRPLDGVAAIAPGDTDRFGRKYDYKEGDNMMIVDGGNYKRWEGVTYLPEDYKGKGEPSYSIEKALKEHKISDNNKADRTYGATGETTGIEMEGGPIQPRDDETGVQRSGSKRHSGSLDGLKRRIGGLGKTKDTPVA